MFDHGKVVKKLKKMEELSGKKSRKVLDAILVSQDFREWLFGSKDNNRAQPINGPMVSEIVDNLAKPASLKVLKKYIKTKPYDEGFDRTSAYIIMLAVHSAVNLINTESEEINAQYKAGEIESKDVKKYKERIETYSQIIEEVAVVLKDRMFNSYPIKKVANACRLPKDLVYSTFTSLPEPKYEPPYKISSHLNSMLGEIYVWAGENGLETPSGVCWEEYFNFVFSRDVAASVAISILLEGVKKIDTYSELDHFDDVSSIWDSLSVYALDILNEAPENVRRHMIDVYLKRSANIFKNNHGNVRLRIDLMNLPSRFGRLIKTVDSYGDSFARLFGERSGGSPTVTRTESKDLTHHSNKNEQAPQKNQSASKSDDDEVDTESTFYPDESDDDDED